jgi:preprotein translocase subunit SecD
VPPAQDAAFREAATEVGANFDRSAGTNGTYTFTMRPNVQINLRDESVVQARQTIERRVNELGVTEPSIAQQGTSGDQILVQLPGVTDVEPREGDHPVDRLLELKIVEQGPSPPRRAARQRPGAAGMEIVPALTARPATPARCTTWSRRPRRSPARDLRNARRRSTRTTSRPSPSR